MKSTILQLDSTFSERDYGTGSFREFMEKMQRAGYVNLRRIDRGYLVETVEGEAEKSAAPAAQEILTEGAPEGIAQAAPEAAGQQEMPPAAVEPGRPVAEAMVLLKQALAAAVAKTPNRPLYMRHIRQALRAANQDFDERRYGFRGFLDLLHQGQREGLCRLQRDRKGVWRIFPATTDAAPPVAATAVGEPEKRDGRRSTGGVADEPAGVGAGTNHGGNRRA